MFEDIEVAARIGLLAPPSNAVMEVELYRSLPRDVTLHTSHIYRTRSTISAEAAAETAANAAQAARTLTQVEPDIVIYGHAASSYTAGIAGDAALAEEIREVAGVPALTTANAVVRCLASIGVRRVAFVAPYAPATAESGANFLRAHGFEISMTVGMGTERVTDLKRVPLHKTYDVALEAASQDATDALYICGTGIRTREIVGPLEAALDKPVITANLASLWAALDAIGRSDRFAFGESRLLEWQRRTRAQMEGSIDA